jgi:hypothetical protein
LPGGGGKDIGAAWLARMMGRMNLSGPLIYCQRRACFKQSYPCEPIRASVIREVFALFHDVRGRPTRSGQRCFALPCLS